MFFYFLSGGTTDKMQQRGRRILLQMAGTATKPVRPQCYSSWRNRQEMEYRIWAGIWNKFGRCLVCSEFGSTLWKFQTPGRKLYAWSQNALTIMILLNGSLELMREVSAKHSKLDKMHLSKLLLGCGVEMEGQNRRKDGREVGLLKWQVLEVW